MYCRGMNTAETKVSVMAMIDPQARVLHTRRALGTRAMISSTPITTSMPPMTASGTFSAWLPNSSTIKPSHRPANTPPSRLLAPAPTLIPVRDSDPPVPIDWKKLPARLPRPSPRKSRDWLALLPSGLGTAVLMPAPCASATSATEIEPSASWGIRLKSGSMKAGRLLGMVAMSPTSSV